ncbi:MAG TPA: ABC-2 family transporter protein [Roseiflexaceae bacterium]|nr:ABC-2 family transporter protein [Roseiflexaceae bacterium]
MIAVRKYTWLGLVAARSHLAYAGEVVTRTIFLGVILFIFLQLWRVTFAESGAARLGGLTLAQMLWYLAITEAIVLSAPRVSHEVDQDVRTGALAVQLIRPLAYPLSRLGMTLGERLVRFALNAAVGAAIALAFVGPIPLAPQGLLLFAVALLAAFVLDFLFLLLIGLAAFWIEDTSGLWLIYSRVTMILGGMLLPLELFPAQLQPLLRALPFSGMVYGPGRMFVLPDAGFLAELFARQLAAAALLSLAAAAVYRAGIRRIHSNGG